MLIDNDIALILSLFLLTQEAQKKKLRKKKNAVFSGALPHSPQVF
jgi:hypothetical protein